MSRTIEALKKIGKKCNSAGIEPTGNTIEEVINNIADNFDIGNGGATITAITLNTTDGAITGGTATMSDGKSIKIKVAKK